VEAAPIPLTKALLVTWWMWEAGTTEVPAAGAAPSWAIAAATCWRRADGSRVRAPAADEAARFCTRVPSRAMPTTVPVCRAALAALAARPARRGSTEARAAAESGDSISPNPMPHRARRQTTST